MQSSIWEKESFFAPKDVIIVGSGFTGLWSAYFLKKRAPKLSIAIVDRGIIPAGASTRNAGFSCFGSVTELWKDAQQMGADKMVELVEMRYRGLQKIKKLFGKKAIDYDPCGGYEMITAKDELPEEELAGMIPWLNKTLSAVVKKKNTFSFADEKIADFGFQQVTHLLQNKLEGALHPGKLCQALLQTILAMGVEVFNSIAITGFEKTGDLIELYTNQHISLSAGKLLVCSNAFAKDLLPELDVVPARAQVLVTAPLPQLPFEGTFHYDQGFYYFRNLGSRVLLGGARNTAFEAETTTEMVTTESVQQELEHFLSRYILPGIPYTITDRWSGIMGMGKNKMPVIREAATHVYCAVRMSGMGVALAPAVGEAAAGMMID